MVRNWIIKFMMVSFLVMAPTTVAANTIYPLTSWQVTTRHGEVIGDSYYHMGIDAGFELGAGAEVYAIEDGIVREAKERTSFGLVVLIEHEASRVSVYGHLDPADVRVTPGDYVTAGTIIGSLGSSDTNGGWEPHLHFGIHKQPYTGVWVYYGHVLDANTTKDWFDPEKYIPKHLSADLWLPTVTSNLIDGAVVGNDKEFVISPRDLGSLVRVVRYLVSADGVAWTTVGERANPIGNISETVSLVGQNDGPLFFKIVARDNFNNKTVQKFILNKDAVRYGTPAWVILKPDAVGMIAQPWSFGGEQLSSLQPFSNKTLPGSDLATGDVLGLGETQLIIGRGSKNQSAILKIFSATEDFIKRISLVGYNDVSLASGDVTGDGAAEIIVGSGKNVPAAVAAVDATTGSIIWSVPILTEADTTGVNVAAGNVDEDGAVEIVVATRAGVVTRLVLLDNDGASLGQFSPGRRNDQTGASVAIGNVTGDSGNELIVGLAGNPATIYFFTPNFDSARPTWQPLADIPDAQGEIDLATLQWDNDWLELIISQATPTVGYVRIYSVSTKPAMLMEEKIDIVSVSKTIHIEGYR